MEATVCVCVAYLWSWRACQADCVVLVWVTYLRVCFAAVCQTRWTEGDHLARRPASFESNHFLKWNWREISSPTFATDLGSPAAKALLLQLLKTRSFTKAGSRVARIGLPVCAWWMAVSTWSSCCEWISRTELKKESFARWIFLIFSRAAFSRRRASDRLVSNCSKK